MHVENVYVKGGVENLKRLKEQKIYTRDDRIIFGTTSWLYVTKGTFRQKYLAPTKKYHTMGQSSLRKVRGIQASQGCP